MHGPERLRRLHVNTSTQNAEVDTMFLFAKTTSDNALARFFRLDSLYAALTKNKNSCIHKSQDYYLQGLNGTDTVMEQRVTRKFHVLHRRQEKAHIDELNEQILKRKSIPLPYRSKSQCEVASVVPFTSPEGFLGCRARVQHVSPQCGTQLQQMTTATF